MTGWNSSFPSVTVKGTCPACGQYFERKLSVHAARQLKEPHCGKLRCRDELSIRRCREKRERLAKNQEANK